MTEQVSIITILVIMCVAFLGVTSMYKKNYWGIFIAAILHLITGFIDPIFTVLCIGLAVVEIIIGIIIIFKKRRNREY